MVSVQRMEPAIDAGVLATLATVCCGPLHVGVHYRDLCAYLTRTMAGVHQRGDQSRVVLHQPRAVMAKTIPPSAATREMMDGAHCLMLCGTGQLDSLVYWQMALDAEFEVLEPSTLKERLPRASERVGRSGGQLPTF